MCWNKIFSLYFIPGNENGKSNSSGGFFRYRQWKLSDATTGPAAVIRRILVRVWRRISSPIQFKLERRILTKEKIADASIIITRETSINFFF